MKTQNKNVGRKTGHRGYELTDLIPLFLAEFRGGAQQYVKSREAVPVEFSAIGLSKIFNTPLNNINEPLKTLREENKTIVRHEKKHRLTGFNGEKVELVYSLSSDISPREYTEDLSYYGDQIIKYTRDGDEIDEKLSEIYSRLEKEFHGQKRILSYSGLARWVPRREELITWEDIYSSVPFRTDVEYMVRSRLMKTNISLKEFLDETFETRTIPSPNIVSEFIEVGKENIKSYGGSESDSDNLWTYSKVIDSVYKGNFTVLVSGNPGIGKSNLLRTISMDLFKEWRHNVIPGYIHASEYNPEFHGCITEFVREQLNISDNPVLVSGFNEIVKEGRLVLLIDGLDELQQKLRNDFIKKIMEMKMDWDVNNSSMNSIIISTRPGFVDIGKITHLEIQSFNDKQVKQYVEQKLSSHQEKAQHLLEQISQDTSLNDITSNPLHLSQICEIYLDGKDIPRTKVDIYDSFIHLLLERGKNRSNVQASDRARKDQKINFLERIALEMMSNRKIGISIDEFPKSILKFLPSGYSLPELLDELVSEDGVLIHTTQEYHFYHKSIQEFLSARRIKMAETKDRYLCSDTTLSDIEWWMPVVTYYTSLGDSSSLIEAMDNNYEEDLLFTKLLVMAGAVANAKEVGEQIVEDVSNKFIEHFGELLECSSFMRDSIGLESGWPGIGSCWEIINGIAQRVTDSNSFLDRLIEVINDKIWLDKDKKERKSERIPPELVFLGVEKELDGAISSFIEDKWLLMSSLRAANNQKQEEYIRLGMTLIDKVLNEPDKFERLIENILWWERRDVLDKGQLESLQIKLIERYHKLDSKAKGEETKQMVSLLSKIVEIAGMLHPEESGYENVLPPEFWNHIYDRYYDIGIPFKYGRLSLKNEKDDAPVEDIFPILMGEEGIIEQYRAIIDLINPQERHERRIILSVEEWKKLKDDLIESDVIEQESDWVIRNLLIYLLSTIDDDVRIFDKLIAIERNMSSSPDWNQNTEEDPILLELEKKKQKEGALDFPLWYDPYPSRTAILSAIIRFRSDDINIRRKKMKFAEKMIDDPFQSIKAPGLTYYLSNTKGKRKYKGITKLLNTELEYYPYVPILWWHGKHNSLSISLLHQDNLYVLFHPKKSDIDYLYKQYCTSTIIEKKRMLKVLIEHPRDQLTQIARDLINDSEDERDIISTLETIRRNDLFKNKTLKNTTFNIISDYVKEKVLVQIKGEDNNHYDFEKYKDVLEYLNPLLKPDELDLMIPNIESDYILNQAEKYSWNEWNEFLEHIYNRIKNSEGKEYGSHTMNSLLEMAAKKHPAEFIDIWRARFVDLFIEEYATIKNHYLYIEYNMMSSLFHSEDLPTLFERFKKIHNVEIKKWVLYYLWGSAFNVNNIEYLHSFVVPYLVENWAPEYIVQSGPEEQLWVDGGELTDDTAFNTLYEKVWERYKDSRMALMSRLVSTKHYIQTYEEFLEGNSEPWVQSVLVTGMKKILYLVRRSQYFEDEPIPSIDNDIKEIIINMVEKPFDVECSAFALMSLEHIDPNLLDKKFCTFCDGVINLKNKQNFDFSTLEAYKFESGLKIESIAALGVRRIKDRNPKYIGELVRLLRNNIIQTGEDENEFVNSLKSLFGYILFEEIDLGEFAHSLSKDSEALAIFTDYIREEGRHFTKAGSRVKYPQIGLVSPRYLSQES